jgi:hypothetical protein
LQAILPYCIEPSLLVHPLGVVAVPNGAALVATFTPMIEGLRLRGFGLVLIGMPGLEKRLARYAQFYSRVGFVHHYRTLSADAMRLVVAYAWQQLGLTLVPDDFNDAEAMVAIIRITGGNLRLVQRLLSQIECVLPINRLQAVTPEVVEAARQSLVIGSG